MPGPLSSWTRFCLDSRPHASLRFPVLPFTGPASCVESRSERTRLLYTPAVGALPEPPRIVCDEAPIRVSLFAPPFSPALFCSDHCPPLQQSLCTSTAWRTKSSARATQTQALASSEDSPASSTATTTLKTTFPLLLSGYLALSAHIHGRLIS